MSTTISGDTGVTFPNASVQSVAVSQATPFSVTASAIAGAEIQFPEATNNGVSYVALKGPNSLAANITFTLPIADGTNGQYLQTNGTGQLTFASVSPGGTTGQIQFNNAGVFGGVTAVPVANGGTGATTLTANNVLLGNGTSALQAVAPGTAGNLLTSDGTTWVSQALSTAVQYPQNSQSANYTLVLGDAGKQIFHPVADTNIRTYTIPANSSVAFPIGTVVLFTVENGAQPVIVAITSDTLVLGTGTTGSVFLNQNNTLTAIKVTSTKWMANLDFQLATQSIAVGHDNSPYITAYPWSRATGFGTKLGNPATLPNGTGYDIAFTTSGDAIALAHSTSPFVSAYPWTGSFGTKFADPATLPTGAGLGIAFSPTANAIAVAHLSSPFVSAYSWSGSGFGTKFTNPATLPASNGRSVAFSPNGSAIAIAHDTSPYVTAYPWSGSGFGTKFADPATLPTGTGYGVAFSPAGDAIAVAHSSSPNVTAYPWSGSGFGTKYANPATLPASSGESVAFSPAGDAIAVAHNASPFVTAYPWSGSGFGTKYTNPATPPASTGFDVAFSAANDAIAVAHDTSPFVSAYPWSGSGFGTKFANPATLPAGIGNAVAFTINP
jgi:hypothetical protein